MSAYKIVIRQAPNNAAKKKHLIETGRDLVCAPITIPLVELTPEIRRRLLAVPVSGSEMRDGERYVTADPTGSLAMTWNPGGVWPSYLRLDAELDEPISDPVAWISAELTRIEAAIAATSREREERDRREAAQSAEMRARWEADRLRAEAERVERDALAAANAAAIVAWAAKRDGDVRAAVEAGYRTGDRPSEMVVEYLRSEIDLLAAADRYATVEEEGRVILGVLASQDPTPGTLATAARATARTARALEVLLARATSVRTAREDLRDAQRRQASE